MCESPLQTECLVKIVGMRLDTKTLQTKAGDRLAGENIDLIDTYSKVEKFPGPLSAKIPTG